MGEGDYVCSGYSVDLSYNYVDPENPGVTETRTLSTVTDSEGRYHFNNIPLMTDGSRTDFSVTVSLAMPSYKVTTNYTVTNSDSTVITPTNGTLVQSGQIYGYDTSGNKLTVSTAKLSDIGINYTKISKSITFMKDWVVDIFADSKRPEAVSFVYNTYYFDYNNVKTSVGLNTVVLNNLDNWREEMSYLPMYYDSEIRYELHYEIISETYTLRGETTPYTFTEASTGTFPYDTSFSVNETIATTQMIVTNAPKTSSIQLIKRDADDSSILIQGVEFTLWEKTALSSIPAENPDEYENVGGSIFKRIQTQSSNSNGVVVFSGLSSSSYFAVESSAANGYVLDTEHMEFEFTGVEHKTHTVYNTRTTSSVNIVKNVNSALDGATVPITVTWASDSKFSEDVHTQALSVTVEDGILSYNAGTVIVPWGFYMKVSEGSSPYSLAIDESKVTDNTSSTDILSEYSNNDVFTIVKNHNYTVTLSNKINAGTVKLNIVKNIDKVMADSAVPIKLTYASDASFTKNVTTENYTVSIISNTFSYNVATDVEIPSGYYVKVEEGSCSYTLNTTASNIVNTDTSAVVSSTYSSGQIFNINDNYTVTLTNKANYLSTFYCQKLWINSAGEILDEEQYTKANGTASASSSFSNVPIVLERTSDGTNWSSVTRKSNGNGILNPSASELQIAKAPSSVGITSNITTLLWTKRFGSQYWYLPQFDSSGNRYTYRIRETSCQTGYTEYTGEITYSTVIDGSGKKVTTASFTNPVTGVEDSYTSYAASEVYMQDYQQNFIIINYDSSVAVSRNMSIHKVDGNTNDVLPGAKFSLYSDEQCNTEIASAETSFDSYGNVKDAQFSALLPGTYYLKETEAPAGYQLPADKKTIVVAADGSVTVDGAAVTVTGNEFSITVANFIGITLPESGVSVTGLMIMIAGLILCTLAIIMAAKYSQKFYWEKLCRFREKTPQNN